MKIYQKSVFRCAELYFGFLFIVMGVTMSDVLINTNIDMGWIWLLYFFICMEVWLIVFLCFYSLTGVKISERRIFFSNPVLPCFNKYYRFDEIDHLKVDAGRWCVIIKVYKRPKRSRWFGVLLVGNKDLRSLINDLKAKDLKVELSKNFSSFYNIYD